MKRNGDEGRVWNDGRDGIMVSGTETRVLVKLWEETTYSGQE